MLAIRRETCIIDEQGIPPCSYGLVAQLGERSVRIREVEGSNPFRSTITHRYELFWFKNVFGLTKELPQR